MTDIRFDGKVALITGAGGGLGKTYALEARQARRQDRVNDLGGKADGTGASASMADATGRRSSRPAAWPSRTTTRSRRPEGGKAMVQAAIDNFGRIDVVINNAGILRDKTFAKLEPADLDAVLDVHLKGRVLRDAAGLRKMKEQNYGRIVFTARRPACSATSARQLRRGEDGPGRPHERARARRRQEQHQVQHDRADREDAAHRESAGPHGRHARPRAA
jgi:NAD(P)-dependent dehydrogenase (short-subunit alcohol dehydrogenase family)